LHWLDEFKDKLLGKWVKTDVNSFSRTYALRANPFIHIFSYRTCKDVQAKFAEG
jgi:hypothetical protein